MTYASRLRAKTDPKHPSNVSFPGTPAGVTAWILERKAEEEFQKKVLGGYNKKNRCSECNVCLPKTNICDYCNPY